MCCFSAPVKHVHDTSIFARVSTRGNQILVYSMSLDTAEDVAMILPIPVKAGTTEEQFQFINLEGYPQFFGDLADMFPTSRAMPFGAPLATAPAGTTAPLKIQKVGSFEGSFVPTQADFGRLDERFRIDPAVWKQLPHYKNFGFAVFKFRPGKQEVHPMAFAFPTATPKSIFFPTVHIHDGQVHELENFDHALYCQTGSGQVKMDWEESLQPIHEHFHLRSKKTLFLGQHLYRKRVIGEFKNRDFLIAAV